MLGACADRAASSERPVRRIGLLTGNVRSSVEIRARVLVDELAALGYEPDRDFTIVDRIAENSYDDLPAMAKELVALPVDLIVAEGGAAQFAAKAATTKIPIVLTLGPDPQSVGLVPSIARPGGNVTGISILNNAVMGKKLELLKQVVPTLRKVAVIYNANNKTVDSATYGQLVGPSLGLEVGIFGARDLSELDVALRDIAQSRYEAIATTALLSVVGTELTRIPHFAERWRVPQVFADVEIVRAGGLMFYNVSFADLYRVAARYVDKIFRGAYPGDLPIHEPTELDLVLNLRAAERIGLRFPDDILRRAREIVP